MLLAKSTNRQTEIAVRFSLGAGRIRLVRQLLVESLIYSSAGGLVGLLLSWFVVGAMHHFVPLDIPRILETRIDTGILLFTLIVTILTGFIFGLTPSLTAARINIPAVMHDGQGRSTVGFTRIRRQRILLAFQFALTLMIANHTALLLKSMHNVIKEPLNFDTKEVLTAGITLKGAEYESEEQKRLFWSRLQEAVEHIPGVVSVSLSTLLPLEGGSKLGKSL